MSQNFYRRQSPVRQRLATVFLLITGWVFLLNRVNAQTGYAACQPPGPGESLLLVVAKENQDRQQVRNILPPQVMAVTCQYLDDLVLRVDGFPSINAASNWAEYINSNLGLFAFVAVPQGNSAVPQLPTTTPRPQGYNPQPLDPGYAILVDYFNNPQLAAELQQVLMMILV